MISSLIHRAPALLLALVVFMLTPLSPASALPHQARIDAIFQALHALPNAAAPGSRVIRLAVRITALAPQNGTVFFRVGAAKLANPLDVKKLAIRVIAIVKSSDLPYSAKNQIMRRITDFAAEGPGPPPPDGP